MSLISAAMDVLLVTLLLTALFVGLRLNKRLKALRDGQAGFARAVGELDVAAKRAESALASLRAASEETHDALLTRIETARALILRLENASDAAARAAAAAPSVAQAAPRAESRLDPRFRDALGLSRPRPAARNLDDDLFEAEPLGPLQRRAGGLR